MYLNSFKDLLYIGSGRYSTIYKAKDLKNNRIVALKRIRKNSFDQLDYALECVKREKKIMEECQSSNIFKLYQTIETNDEIVFV